MHVASTYIDYLRRVLHHYTNKRCPLSVHKITILSPFRFYSSRLDMVETITLVTATVTLSHFMDSADQSETYENQPITLIRTRTGGVLNFRSRTYPVSSVSVRYCLECCHTSN